MIYLNAFTLVALCFLVAFGLIAHLAAENKIKLNTEKLQSLTALVDCQSKEIRLLKRNLGTASCETTDNYMTGKAMTQRLDALQVELAQERAKRPLERIKSAWRRIRLAFNFDYLD